MKTKAKHAARGAQNEKPPGGPGGGTTGRNGNGLRKNRKPDSRRVPVVTVRLVLKALASVIWMEGNEIQQVRRNRHLLLQAFDVDSGPYAPYLVAKEVPAAARNDFSGFKGELAWDEYELERRVVEDIAKTRAWWKALSKGERRAIIAERGAYGDIAERGAYA